MERQIVDTLVTMYETTNSEERGRLYQELNNFSRNKIEFMMYLLQALRQDFTIKEKLSVSIFFKTYLNNLIMKKEINAEERKGIFMEILKSDPSVMVHLTPTIESILFFDEADAVGTHHLMEVLFAQMRDNINDVNSGSEIDRIRMFFALFRAAVNVIQDNAILDEKVKEFKDILASAAEKSLEQLRVCYTNSNLEEAKVYIGLVFEFTTILREISGKVSKENNFHHVHINLFTSDNLIKLMNSIIFLGFPTDKVFSSTGNDMIDEKVFNSKINMIKILSYMITLIKPHLHMNNLVDTEFEKLLKSC